MIIYESDEYVVGYIYVTKLRNEYDFLLYNVYSSTELCDVKLNGKISVQCSVIAYRLNGLPYIEIHRGGALRGIVPTKFFFLIKNAEII